MARPVAGDEAWFVEWLVKFGEDEDGYDLDQYQERKVRTREEAIALAKVVIHESVDGQVVFWPAVFEALDERVPWVGYWEATADAETYEEE